MYSVLFKNDMRYLKKDPTLWVLGCIPIIFIAIYWLGLRRIAFLIPYITSIQYLFIIMTGCMGGVLWAIRMLDERDEHMTTYYGISPIGFKGYIKYKMIVSTLYGMLATGIVLIGIGENLNMKLLILLQVGLLAPLVNLCIYAVAKNKIQGMALGKVVGILVVLPLTHLIGENILTPVIKLLPFYGMFKLITQQGATVLSCSVYLVWTVILLAMMWYCCIKNILGRDV